MVGLWRGEGGLVRRLLGEVVPLLVGVAVGSFSGAFLGLVGGIVCGLGAAILVSWLLVRVRRHPRARRVYRVLLALHVAFWSALGLWGSVPEAPPRPATDAQGVIARVAWPEALSFRAGVAEVPFTLPAETTLAGWGGPPRRRRWPAFAGFGRLGRWSLAATGAPAQGGPGR